VKVIAQAGQVTLKGPVPTEEEKESVEAAATESGGRGTRYQSNQHRAVEGLEEVTRGIT
jgi:hypothetical protein